MMICPFPLQSFGETNRNRLFQSLDDFPTIRLTKFQHVLKREY